METVLLHKSAFLYVTSIFRLSSFVFANALLTGITKTFVPFYSSFPEIYSIFAGMAIIISSLGLLGISLFDIRQRYREIAIRKVNGASAKDLYRLLFRKYITVLIIAFVIAIPLAYYLINTYTQDFAVRAPVSIDIFIISLLLVIIISLGTLAYQIQKAAYINPTQIMKTE